MLEIEAACWPAAGRRRVWPGARQRQGSQFASTRLLDRAAALTLVPRRAVVRLLRRRPSCRPLGPRFVTVGGRARFSWARAFQPRCRDFRGTRSRSLEAPEGRASAPGGAQRERVAGDAQQVSCAFERCRVRAAPGETAGSWRGSRYLWLQFAGRLLAGLTRAPSGRRGPRGGPHAPPRGFAHRIRPGPPNQTSGSILTRCLDREVRVDHHRPASWPNQTCLAT